jgi:hypothetical protein
MIIPTEKLCVQKLIAPLLLATALSAAPKDQLTFERRMRMTALAVGHLDEFNMRASKEVLQKAKDEVHLLMDEASTANCKSILQTCAVAVLMNSAAEPGFPDEARLAMELVLEALARMPSTASSVQAGVGLALKLTALQA